MVEKQTEKRVHDTSMLACILCFEIGLRSGELLALKESDIFNRNGNNYIRIQRQQVDATDVSNIDNLKARIGFEVVDYTKSECGTREVPLTERALNIINRIKDINRKHHKPLEGLLFITNGKVTPPHKSNPCNGKSV